jgi:hypothetical protein
MKKLAFLLAGMVALMSLNPCHAAITYSYSGNKFLNNEVIPNYITVTANDTTTPIAGKTIDNRDGRVQSVSLIVNSTAGTGTSPTVQATLQGSNDGTNFVNLYSGDATPVILQTSAQSVSSAVTYGFDTCQEVRCNGGFPAFLRVQTATGGTSSPGWTGTVQVVIKRGAQNISQ